MMVLNEACSRNSILEIRVISSVNILEAEPLGSVDVVACRQHLEFIVFSFEAYIAVIADVKQASIAFFSCHLNDSRSAS